MRRCDRCNRRSEIRRSGEHDVQLVEAAERGEKRTERRNHAPVAREQREHVRLERQPACAFSGDGEDAKRGANDERASTVGPCNEDVDQTGYVTLLRDRDASPSPSSGTRERTFWSGSLLPNRAARHGVHRGRARSARARGHARRFALQRRSTQHLRRARPGLVGIAAMHALETDDVLALAGASARWSSEVTIVVGGHTAAAYPDAVSRTRSRRGRHSTMASWCCRVSLMRSSAAFR